MICPALSPVQDGVVLSEIEFPPGMPDDVQDFLKKQITRSEMETEAHRHELHRFFDELSVDQLRTLAQLLVMCAQQKKIATFYQGYVIAILEQKWDVCAGCGKNHEKMLFEDHEGITNPTFEEMVDQDGPITGLEYEDGMHLGGPAGIVDGDRIDTCSTCHGDKIIKVCEHITGSHGQFTREACPEPTLVPCCECCCPEWYPVNQPLSLHAGCSGSFLPLPCEKEFICSYCGVRFHGSF
jgi:hypothetical protein